MLLFNKAKTILNEKEVLLYHCSKEGIVILWTLISLTT